MSPRKHLSVVGTEAMEPTEATETHAQMMARLRSHELFEGAPGHWLAAQSPEDLQDWIDYSERHPPPGTEETQETTQTESPRLSLVTPPTPTREA